MMILFFCLCFPLASYAQVALVLLVIYASSQFFASTQFWIAPLSIHLESNLSHSICSPH